MSKRIHRKSPQPWDGCGLFQFFLSIFPISIDVDDLSGDIMTNSSTSNDCVPIQGLMTAILPKSYRMINERVKDSLIFHTKTTQQISQNGFYVCRSLAHDLPPSSQHVFVWKIPSIFVPIKEIVLPFIFHLFQHSIHSTSLPISSSSVSEADNASYYDDPPDDDEFYDQEFVEGPAEEDRQEGSVDLDDQREEDDGRDDVFF